MDKHYEGTLLGEGLKFGLVVSRFNEFITTRLLDGARDAFARHGVREQDVELSWTPGCFEIPLVAKKMAESKRYDAIVCLGAVIRGGTPHFDYIAAEVSRGIGRASMETGMPIIFGVITADTLEQAIERAGTKMGNKGFQSAVSAIEMANLLKGLPTSPG
jgi:6,7-dimethyl-8-ribityllumazine synthase